MSRFDFLEKASVTSITYTVSTLASLSVFRTLPSYNILCCGINMSLLKYTLRNLFAVIFWFLGLAIIGLSFFLALLFSHLLLKKMHSLNF